jgi:hypothetical protein
MENIAITTLVPAANPDFLRLASANSPPNNRFSTV